MKAVSEGGQAKAPVLLACIGGAHIDRRGVLREAMVLGTSNPGTVYSDLGGVARNVGQNLARLGCSVLLCSRVGSDEAGRAVLAQPLDTSLISVSQTSPTASYTAILEANGELVIGLADMGVYDEVTPVVLEPALPRLRQAGLWFIDTNLPGDTIAWLLDAAPVPVAVDAISVAKSKRLVGLLPKIPYLFCNLAQAGSIAGVSLSCAEDGARALMGLGARRGVVSFGAHGIAVYENGAVTSMSALKATPRDVTGAGDALVSGTLLGITRGLPLCDAARLGLAAAAITVESDRSSAACLTLEALHARA